MKILKWWLLFCVMLTASAVIYNLGFFHEVWNKDQTKLSFVILGLFLISSLWIGTKTWKSKKKTITESEGDSLWFIAETMLTIGMIGTVAGFILMLGQSFSSIDATQPETLKIALRDMALGMSTALYTTLIGLVCSQLTKIQMMIFESGDD